MALFNRIHKVALLLLKLPKLNYLAEKTMYKKSRWEDQKIKKHIDIVMYE